MGDKDRIENAIRHIQTATDIDPWAMEIAVDAMRRMMNADGDPISRKAVLDMLNCAYSAWCTDDIRKAIERISIAVDDLPSAQPERKKGKWKVQTIKGKDIVYCSECGFGVHGGETRRYRYCPNCGAEMIGGRE